MCSSDKAFKTYIVLSVWNRIQFALFKIPKYSFSLVEKSKKE